MIGAAMVVFTPDVVDARQPTALSEFCGGPPVANSKPRLQPRDEATNRPDFLAFREGLQDAIARKDVEAVLRVTHRDFQLSFDGSGVAVLKNFIEDHDSDFWGEFSRALSMGGTFDADRFSAPYVYSAWPEEFDSYRCSAITASAVRLRDRPSATGATVARLDFDIVEELHEEPETPGWTRVRLVTGLTGFVASQFVRSPIAYRAGFVREDGVWRLKDFAAGD